MANRPKVFCIGFQKTGTTTMQSALTILGYRVTGPNFHTENGPTPDLVERASKVAAEYDAVQDNPWPLLFREMDERFPGSKFVLTVRDTDRWYQSAVRHFRDEETAWRKHIYGAGAPAGNEQLYRSRYASHNREARAYFADRPDDLLVMDVTKGDGWDKLCPFVDLPNPGVPFPHSNSGVSTRTKIMRAIRRVKSRIPS